MSLPLFLVDAFTREPFRGNPLRVEVHDDRVHLRGHAVTVVRGELA